MSDVLAFAHSVPPPADWPDQSPSHLPAVVAGIEVAIFVRDKCPPLETVALAEQGSIPLATSRFTMYASCGCMHASGLLSRGLFALGW